MSSQPDSSSYNKESSKPGRKNVFIVLVTLYGSMMFIDGGRYIVLDIVKQGTVDSVNHSLAKARENLSKKYNVDTSTIEPLRTTEKSVLPLVRGITGVAVGLMVGFLIYAYAIRPTWLNNGLQIVSVAAIIAALVFLIEFYLVHVIASVVVAVTAASRIDREKNRTLSAFTSPAQSSSNSQQSATTNPADATRIRTDTNQEPLVTVFVVCLSIAVGALIIMSFLGIADRVIRSTDNAPPRPPTIQNSPQNPTAFIPSAVGTPSAETQSKSRRGFKILGVTDGPPTTVAPIQIEKPHAVTPPASAISPSLPYTAATSINVPSRTVTNSIGMELMLIPAGEFLMGATVVDTYASQDEKPQHYVRITKTFYLGQTEVTQGQWLDVMKTSPWSEKGAVKAGSDFPATHVSFEDATEFCAKLNALEGKTYRLPTEAEWEYACRAGTTTKYYFGDDESQLGDFAWIKENAWDVNERFPHVVGMKRPNRWGLHDMLGNVSEWCSDWYSSDYYGGAPVTDPTGATIGKGRVVRGGAWANPPTLCRSTKRINGTPDYRNEYRGFRIVLVP